MNQHTPAADVRPARPTTAGQRDGAIVADALPRRAFTWDEVLAMVAAGILSEDDRVELIGGDLVEMSPKGARHEAIRNTLVFRWARAMPETWFVAADTPLTLRADYTPEPDLIVHRATAALPAVPPDAIAVVVEIAGTSLAYDLSVKAGLYARFGIVEYWVINARTLETTVHRRPTAEGYEDVAVHGPDARLSPLAVPQLETCIGALGLDPKPASDAR